VPPAAAAPPTPAIMPPPVPAPSDGSIPVPASSPSLHAQSAQSELAIANSRIRERPRSVVVVM
jgi:hypothetical protein